MWCRSPTATAGRLLVIPILLFVLSRDAAAAPWFSYSGSSIKEKNSNLEKEDDPNNIDDIDNDVLVSPIVNRELLASVVAHSWPSTPQSAFCEAYAYYSVDGAGQEYLEALVTVLLQQQEEEEFPRITSWREAVPLSSLPSSSSYSSSSSSALLEFSLAMRAFSPTCELHRGLAREALRKSNHLPGTSSTTDLDAFALVYPAGKVLMLEDLLAVEDFSAYTTTSTSTTTSSILDMDALLLPDEVPIGKQQQQQQGSDSDSDVDVLVFLHANLGTRAFVHAYQKLRRLISDNNTNMRFVVRHLGAVGYEEDASTASSTVLQGYGVRLDIRNVEYKVFDDRSSDNSNSQTTSASDKDHNGMLNLTETAEQGGLVPPLPEYLAGVNLTALFMGMETDEEDTKDMNTSRLVSIQTELWKKHASQQAHASIIPPVWQRRQLSMQAATVIAFSTDPLVTLQEVSQNLPSVASSLVHVKIPDSIMGQQATAAQQLVSGVLYVNGRVVSFGRPSLNVFELLDLFRKEQAKLTSLQEKLRPFLEGSQLVAVQQAWMMGGAFMATTSSVDAISNDNGDAGDEENGQGPPAAAATAVKDAYRVDVGRGWKHAVIYVNDLEKDAQYEQWGRSVSQALMNMQFGMPPAVRRNLFTFLAVMDPIDTSNEQPPQNVGMTLAFQLLQSNFPARLGVLFVNQQDVRDCQAWILSSELPGDDVPCPQKNPILDGSPSLEDLKDVKATTQALHRLFTKFAVEFEKESGAAMAYLEYLLPSLSEQLEDADGELSMSDLVTVHGNLMEGLRIKSLEEAQAEALETLLMPDNEGEIAVEGTSYTYGHALRFAANKALKPGMGFLNGRPLPGIEDDGEGVRKVFGEEQQHVFGMIASGEISDRGPASVYAKLLTGDRVFKKFHPLLAGGSGNEDMYVEVIHGFGKDSLLEPASVTPDSSSSSVPFFVVEAYVDFGGDKGFDLAGKLVDLLDSFPPSLASSSSSGGKEDVRLAYRILPRGSSETDGVLCQILAHASLLGVSGVQSVFSILATSGSSATSVEDLLESVPVSEETRMQITSSATKDVCSTESKADMDFLSANGRIFSFEYGTIPTRDDIELLLSIELARAKSVTKLVDQSGSTISADSVSRVASFLAREELMAEKRRNPKIPERSDSQLRFDWNHESSGDDLKVHVTAVVDPVTEAAQRLSPLLRIMRDQLGVPLTVLLAPEPLIDGDSKVPITSYYRFVAGNEAWPDEETPEAHFTSLPTDHVLTLRMDVPEPWNVQQSYAVQDTDNLRCDIQQGCGDEAQSDETHASSGGRYLTQVRYGLKSLLVFGQCYELSGKPPSGLQLTLTRKEVDVDVGHEESNQDVEVGMDGTISESRRIVEEPKPSAPHSDTLVMKNVGYWQLHAGPGAWSLQIAENSKGTEIFDIVEGTFRGGQFDVRSEVGKTSKSIVMKDFVNQGELLLVKRRQGYEQASLFHEEQDKSDSDEPINVFSLATGHLYERFLKIMMLSVNKRTSRKVKFWLFENFLSPSFKESAQAMAKRIGSEVEFVTYKWPEWLRGQSEKQRIIWGYKILFLDVLFPLNVKKIIYVDADQVLRGDLAELWDLDLEGAPYGYTPFCTSRETTLGYQFWNDGFWKSHLRGKPYHISALYVVDLELFRKTHVGDKLRATYQQLSADPNSLSNLDQDLPNYAQHQVPIFSLPQDWLWCESWCSDETKATSKTIDLCNNPMHKEPKVSMAKRIISGQLFNESWDELDAEVERYEKEYYESLQ